MPLLECLARTWNHIHRNLFPWLTEQLGPLTEMHKQVVIALEVADLEGFVQTWSGEPGRPPRDRVALAQAFVAKAVLDLPTTVMLIDRLEVDKTLRRICGWERVTQIPSESTFSRAFAEFAKSGLPERVHEALVRRTYTDRLVGHISRDATAIEAREKPVKIAASPSAQASSAQASSAQASTSAQPPAAPAEPVAPKRKRGRPKKGEVVAPKEPSRLERQTTMSLAEMLADLPTHCAIGCKRNAKGHTVSWIGYKLHLDIADGDIPISAMLTSASLHDSQAAIPLATITAGRVTNLYDLMDAAYDASEITANSIALGHVPIIDTNPRNTLGLKEAIATEAQAQRNAGYILAEDRRYNQRSSSERVNGGVKDSYGARHVRVRGHRKVFCHLMFGILAFTAHQLMRMVT
jgi:Transposase DDE domain/Transposase domain (DUF772)